MGSGFSGRWRKASRLAAGLITLSTFLSGTPAADAEPGRENPAAFERARDGSNGDISREVGGGTEVPCGTVRDGSGGGTGEEPRVSDSPCSIETLRNRAAKARIPMPALPGRPGS